MLSSLAALDVFMTFGRDLWQFDDARQQHIIRLSSVAALFAVRVTLEFKNLRTLACSKSS